MALAQGLLRLDAASPDVTVWTDAALAALLQIEDGPLPAPAVETLGSRLPQSDHRSLGMV
jgi:hypothetical protein